MKQQFIRQFVIIIPFSPHIYLPSIQIISYFEVTLNLTDLKRNCEVLDSSSPTGLGDALAKV